MTVTTDLRVQLVTRLRMRQSEIEAAIQARIRLLLGDPERYDVALWSSATRAVEAYVDISLAMIEARAPRLAPALPVAPDLYRQAALAGVSLASVLRCFTIGAAELWDAIIETTADDTTAAERTELLREALDVQTALFDRLIHRVAHEYVRVVARQRSPREQQRARQVQRILGGVRFDADELGYELELEHLGLIVCGPAPTIVAREIAVGLGCQLLTVERSGTTTWAWLGSRGRLSPADLDRHLTGGSNGARIAIGEPARGIDGFRLTHRQARAAHAVAERIPQRLTRYADVALLAAALQDDALAESLVSLYLSPLGVVGHEVAVLRATLRAYFASGRNASAAAATLGVSRRTISNRLRRIEQRLGSLLETRQAELEIALRLAQMQEAVVGPNARDAHDVKAGDPDLPTLA